MVISKLFHRKHQYYILELLVYYFAEELSEPEVNGTSTSMSATSHTDTESSSMSSFGEEFYDQLAVLKGKFRTFTEQIVDNVQDR